MKALVKEYNFVLLFGVYFCLFYGITYAVIGLAAPGGLYVQWIQEHFNYVNAFRYFLLKTSAVVLDVAGMKYQLTTTYIKAMQGSRIRVNNGCLGIGVLSFWWALILSFPQTIKLRLQYLLMGTAAIILLNVTRITALAIIYRTKNFALQTSIDHHFVFNIAIYIILGFMMIKWLNQPYQGQKLTLKIP